MSLFIVYYMKQYGHYLLFSSHIHYVLQCYFKMSDETVSVFYYSLLSIRDKTGFELALARNGYAT